MVSDIGLYWQSYGVWEILHRKYPDLVITNYSDYELMLHMANNVNGNIYL